MAEEMNQNVQPQGWKDVQITPDMALSMIVLWPPEILLTSCGMPPALC